MAAFTVLMKQLFREGRWVLVSPWWGDLGEKVPRAHPPELTATPGDASLLSCTENSVKHTGLEVCFCRSLGRPMSKWIGTSLWKREALVEGQGPRRKTPRLRPRAWHRSQTKAALHPTCPHPTCTGARLLVPKIQDTSPPVCPLIDQTLAFPPALLRLPS